MNNFIKNHNNWFAFIFFLGMSFLFNCFSIVFLSIAHVYDIIHFFPTIFSFEYIISPLLNNLVITEFIFVPLAIFIDGLIGLILNKALRKIFKKEKSYIISLIISFLFYWFIVTFQWLPII